MKFAIFREIEKNEKKQRVVYAEWDKDRIINELFIELNWPNIDLTQAFNNIIEKFKKESIKIP